MRILRLELKAYGHFTEVSLDFSSATPGLHILYGPNEGGKSTALRALRGLLYGMPLRTPDNFLHDYHKLLVGGCLENADGRTLTFWRRKKSAGDLLDANLHTIDREVLNEFLHGIEEPLFNTLFGIDHETLVSGGRDILEQKGDVGQALFSAGAGLSSLHGVIEALDREQGELFKAGGSRPELNQAIKSHQHLKKEIRDLSLAGSAWKEQQEAFESASAALEEIERKNHAIRSMTERLKRLQRASPHLAKRSALRERLASLGDLGHLPPDFASRVKAAFDRHQQIAGKLENAQSRRLQLEQKQSGCSVRQEILDQSATIDNLIQALGVQRQARKDRPGLHAHLIRCRTEAQALLNQVAPALDLSQTEEIKSLLARRQTILTLGNQFAGLEGGLGKAKLQADRLARQLDDVRSELESLPAVADLSELSAAVTAARKAGDLDGTLRRLDGEIQSLLEKSEADLQRIGLWSGKPEDLPTLPLPSIATVDRFVDSHRELMDGQRDHQNQRQAVQTDLERVRSGLREMQMTGAVVTEDDLARARGHRDRGWRLIRRAWLGGEALGREIHDYDEARDLPDAFEASLRSADEISDHLRSAADRVHQYASLVADAEKLEGQRQRLDDDLAGLAERQKRLHLEWLEVWKECALAPLSPREMRAWLEQCQDIRRTVQEARNKETERQPLLAHRQNLLGSLTEALQGLERRCTVLGDALAPLLTRGEQVLTEFQGVQDQRTALQKDCRRLVKELQSAGKLLEDSQREMDAWTTQWASALAGFGLAVDARPDEAARALENLRNCLERNGQASGFEERLREIDQHSESFEKSVIALVRSIAPELEGLPADQSVVKLQALLKEATASRSLHRQIAADLEEVGEEIRQARVELEGVEKELSALRQLARCDTGEALLAVDRRFGEYLEARKELAEAEETLFGIAEGVALDDLEKQRLEADPNELPGRIEMLNRQIRDELEPQIKALSERKGAARNELQRMDGSGRAAAREDEAQAASAKVRRLAERYLRVRLAALLLKREIDRYRQQHQDPILKIASRYFAELTRDALAGLRADVDDHGQPILVGVCPDGGSKTVEEMSSGTRDQLYLALRLATLEWRLERHEAMPFIADDILVNFDDARSEATLNALASLGEKNQVILFTHHRQIVQSARSLGLDGRVFVHAVGALA